MRRLLLVAGARPNFMKIAPLMEMLARSGIQTLLVHTGQHYDAGMSRVFFDELGIPRPDVNLGVGSGSHAEQTARVMLAFEPVCADWSPECVVLVGDVNSTVACALVAAKLGVAVAHVEAGLRSHDWEMPEEINRVVTDRLSDLLFTTEPSANENLRREGFENDHVYYVGNVMIDTLLRHRDQALAMRMPARMGVKAGDYILVTLHRPSNVASREALEPILLALDAMAEEAPVLFPMHPRTRKSVEAFGLGESLRRVTTLQPLGYLEFLGLMSEAGAVMTDSGGIQEETTALGVPCLTRRSSTERPVTLDQGTNRLVGSDPEEILIALRIVLASGSGLSLARRPELWDGKAAERITTILAGTQPRKRRVN